MYKNNNKQIKKVETKEKTQKNKTFMTLIKRTP